ncbi:4821_t:CDS:2 [Funneliformis caledonium]|uniref:4821_t:CDS:1 n=1 Tax=Funneliformis caledonium TaxID=1117310 RepID=A0A9N9F7H6_9GLOM|nr:4821_t:CDS:2 [Funneliformis caledonium]
MKAEKDPFNISTDARQENDVIDDNEMQENVEFYLMNPTKENTNYGISEASEVKLEMNGYKNYVPVPDYIQKYFDDNCENVDKNERQNAESPKYVFGGGIKNVDDISGGLGPFGTPASCMKKQYVDKVKLMVMLRDSLNQFFKENRHVNDEQRKELIVYGWLQIGVELNLYAMDWVGSGIYRFGKVDKCLLPVDEDDSNILDDVYCILISLESKLLESEKVIKKIMQKNTKNKRRRNDTENSPNLNKNRTPK